MTRTRRLRRSAEAIAFWLVTAPLLALLPARLAYRAACLRGDLTFWYWPEKRAEVMHGLRQVLGEEVSAREAAASGPGLSSASAAVKSST